LPTATAGNDIVIVSPLNKVLLKGSGVDPDGVITSRKWNKLSGPIEGTIALPDSFQTTVESLAVGVYLFQLTVTDNRGGYGRDTVKVTMALPPNILPEAYAGNDTSVLLPDRKVVLQGHGTDADGTITRHKWREITNLLPDGIKNSDSALIVVENLEANKYAFELTVTDNRGGTAKDTVYVTSKTLSASRATVFPNPASNKIYLKIESNTAYNKSNLIIYDMTGKPVYTETFVRTQTSMVKEIDISSLLPGTYIIDVAADINKRVSCKVIKN
jgi:hypothetical protein